MLLDQREESREMELLLGDYLVCCFSSMCLQLDDSEVLLPRMQYLDGVDVQFRMSLDRLAYHMEHHELVERSLEDQRGGSRCLNFRVCCVLILTPNYLLLKEQ
jgi:hypothetical protein